MRSKFLMALAVVLCTTALGVLAQQQQFELFASVVDAAGKARKSLCTMPGPGTSAFDGSCKVNSWPYDGDDGSQSTDTHAAMLRLLFCSSVVVSWNDGDV